MKGCLRKICPQWLHAIYADTKFWLRFHFCPKGLVSEMFHDFLGYDINWRNPQDINEKINWMKFNYDTSKWTVLADKYLVREYVKERIGEQYLVKLYGAWNKADEIDFSVLPDKFIFKTNHGAGTVMPVLDKSKLDINNTKSQLEKWVNMSFGYDTVEPHYLKIKPVIIAEQLLENDSLFSQSLVDYKVYCLDGQPFCILVCTDRIIGRKAHYSYYDCNWNPLPHILCEHLKGSHIDIQKPECLDRLLDCAAKLAKGHPQVRVDFYIVCGHIYFGEMTFTSNGGYDSDITREFSLEMGSHITLPICNTHQ